MGEGIEHVTDSVNKAQAYFQKVSRGGSSNLLTSATRHCRRAPTLLADGLDETKQAQDLIGQHLVLVATGAA